MAIRVKPVEATVKPESPAKSDTSYAKKAALLRPLRRRRRIDGITVVFSLIGAAVLALHLRAHTVSLPPDVIPEDCTQQVYPWFSSKPMACSVFEYNCYRHGDLSPSPDALSHLNGPALYLVYFTHCPGLIVPTEALPDFHDLRFVRIYNSTLVEWKTATYHTNTQRISSVWLVRTDMAQLPQAMITAPIARTLLTSVLVKTNLTTLPDDLSTRIGNRRLNVLFVESGIMTAVPPALCSMNVGDLSFANNAITAVPSCWADKPRHYNFINLADNPLSTIPSRSPSATSSTTFGEFVLDRTLVTTLPSWVTGRSGGSVYMLKTPFCTNNAQLPSTAVKIVCATPHRTTNGSFRLASTDGDFAMS
ncbi:hypothetical protein ATCC90586_003020 [Pythium insidiosum]|nr:hypothetical protein ATCC90586_003020 [Pythium insidiosum]